MPQALTVSPQGKLRLSNFDEAQLFFLKLADEDSSEYLLETAASTDGPMFVGGLNLLLTNEKQLAARWEILPYTPFRGGPLDVAFQLKLVGGGERNHLILASKEHSGDVMLVDPAEAETSKDKNGNLAINIGWEATPDCDEACEGELTDVPDWLQDMLMA